MEPQLDEPFRSRLVAAAREAARMAYCPYSKFRVGAAVLADGEIWPGCNIENASYGLTVCAERAAISTAVSAGKRRIRGLAVICLDVATDAPWSYRMPCGACRQVMAEFALPTFRVLVEGVGEFSLGDLLPDPFHL